MKQTFMYGWTAAILSLVGMGHLAEKKESNEIKPYEPKPYVVSVYGAKDYVITNYGVQEYGSHKGKAPKKTKEEKLEQKERDRKAKALEKENKKLNLQTIK